ncbi:zinc finger MYM-type protein 1-like [Heracleum sosnowskyi]|uniref:Zinc finger MYM-type protein 1-like n=1 Tax=Heracleum sosnowskyi TaxID=360622 RepID=A0AAD8I8I7_9APIA|nr:zinc finger MYM-type protein 1-like [Heracleum sosnowskyi]
MSDQHSRKRMKSFFSFYKRDGGDSTQTPAPASSNSVPVTPNQPNHLPIDEMEVIVETPNKPAIQTDPGLRDPICTFPVNQQDRIRKEYVKLGPCQPKLQNYPTTFDDRDNRRFQYRWFELFPWLEYSVAKDKAFCFPCFLFEKDPPRFPLFTTVGCCNWSRMLAGKKGVCESHVGQTNSFHLKNVQSWANLQRTSQHIDRVIEKLPPEIVRQNRLRLKTTIAACKYLVKEGFSFRGHDESSNSNSRWHFIEIIKSYADMNDEIAKVVLENAPKHAMYIAPSIQKEILDIIVTKIRNQIRREVGDAKFCILVDESLDVSHKEQMAIILRFVDEEGYVRERFFEIVSVKDTTSINLKEYICLVLSTNKLQVQNIRVLSTKTLLQALRDDGWANFLQSVQQFVDDHGLEMPHMGAAYSMEAIIDHFESIGDRKAQFR